MCLYSINKNPFIAKKDLICYKRIFSVKGKIITPYQRSKFSFNTLLFGKGKCKPIKSKVCNSYIIEAGYIHAYTDLNTAIEDRFNKFEIVVKCIIPQGAKYYLGEGNEICASRMIIGKDADTVYYSKFSKLINSIINYVRTRIS